MHMHTPPNSEMIIAFCEGWEFFFFWYRFCVLWFVGGNTTKTLLGWGAECPLLVPYPLGRAGVGSLKGVVWCWTLTKALTDLQEICTQQASIRMRPYPPPPAFPSSMFCLGGLGVVVTFTEHTKDVFRPSRV